MKVKNLAFLATTLFFLSPHVYSQKNIDSLLLREKNRFEKTYPDAQKINGPALTTVMQQIAREEGFADSSKKDIAAFYSLVCRFEDTLRYLGVKPGDYEHFFNEFNKIFHSDMKAEYEYHTGYLSEPLPGWRNRKHIGGSEGGDWYCITGTGALFMAVAEKMGFEVKYTILANHLMAWVGNRKSGMYCDLVFGKKYSGKNAVEAEWGRIEDEFPPSNTLKVQSIYDQVMALESWKKGDIAMEMGVILPALELFDDTERLFKQAIEKNPKISTYYRLLGEYYDYRGNPGAAIIFYKKAREINPAQDVENALTKAESKLSKSKKP